MGHGGEIGVAKAIAAFADRTATVTKDALDLLFGITRHENDHDWIVIRVAWGETHVTSIAGGVEDLARERHIGDDRTGWAPCKILPIRLIGACDGEADFLLRCPQVLPRFSCSAANPRRNVEAIRAVPSRLAHESVPSSNTNDKLSRDVMSDAM